MISAELWAEEVRRKMLEKVKGDASDEKTQEFVMQITEAYIVGFQDAWKLFNEDSRS